MSLQGFRSLELDNSVSRIAIRSFELEMCNSRERITNPWERITNPWERITNPWERIAQFDITNFENPNVPSGLSYFVDSQWTQNFLVRKPMRKWRAAAVFHHIKVSTIFGFIYVAAAR